MKFFVAVSTLVIAITAAQTASPAAVNSTSNSSKVPSPSMTPVAPPSTGTATSAPNATSAPIMGASTPGGSLAPVAAPMVSLSPFIPPVTLPPYPDVAPVTPVPTSEAPVVPPTTAAPVTKPPNPNASPCNVCGGSLVMTIPDEKVSSGFFGDVSCMYVDELGRGGYFTEEECIGVQSVVLKPCGCEAPSTEAPSTSAANTTNSTSTNAPTMKPTKTSSAVTIGTNGAIVAALSLLYVVLK